MSEPDMIDMMSEDELRRELRVLVRQYIERGERMKTMFNALGDSLYYKEKQMPAIRSWFDENGEPT